MEKIKITRHISKPRLWNLKKDNLALNIKQEFQNNAITIRNLTKKFKTVTAVNNVNITVKKGTIHGFIGPNGSGKTTTIKCLINAIIASTGEMYIFGLKASSIEAKKQIGYIPESARFPKRVSTIEYLTSMGQISGLSRKVALAKSLKILEELQLIKQKKQNPNSFSSGMKKKVLLAQALINNPNILILDEPAANLDPSARIDLMNELKKLRDQGKTIFISSHILTELQTLVDEVTILNFSKVVYQGAVKSSSEEIQYEFDTNDNEATVKILKKLQIEFEPYTEFLMITVNDNEQIQKLIKECLAAKINIKLVKPHTLDLQVLYEKIIMEQKNQSTTKGAK